MNLWWNSKKTQESITDMKREMMRAGLIEEMLDEGMEEMVSTSVYPKKSTEIDRKSIEIDRKSLGNRSKSMVFPWFHVHFLWLRMALNSRRRRKRRSTKCWTGRHATMLSLVLNRIVHITSDIMIFIKLYS